MSFFAAIEMMSILERNSQRIEGMEMREMRRMVKQFRVAREEIKNKLLLTHGGTFTEAKLKNALVQIEDALRILNNRTTKDAQQSFAFFTDQGVEDGVREVNSFEKAFTGVTSGLPMGQIIESTNPANMLFNNYQSSLENYSSGLRTKLQNSLTQSLMQSKSWSQAVWDLDGVGNLDEWILERIVRTELHGIYGMSKVNSFGTIQEKYLPDLKKTLYHPMDSRTGDDSKTASRKSLIVDIKDPFIYEYQGKTRVFMSPPDRPNDRSIVIPYRSAWEK